MTFPLTIGVFVLGIFVGYVLAYIKLSHIIERERTDRAESGIDAATLYLKERAKQYANDQLPTDHSD